MPDAPNTARPHTTCSRLHRDHIRLAACGALSAGGGRPLSWGRGRLPLLRHLTASGAIRQPAFFGASSSSTTRAERGAHMMPAACVWIDGEQTSSCTGTLHIRESPQGPQASKKLTNPPSRSPLPPLTTHRSCKTRLSCKTITPHACIPAASITQARMRRRATVIHNRRGRRHAPHWRQQHPLPAPPQPQR